jgi:hypothetical protein
LVRGVAFIGQPSLGAAQEVTSVAKAMVKNMAKTVFFMILELREYKSSHFVFLPLDNLLKE